MLQFFLAISVMLGFYGDGKAPTLPPRTGVIGTPFDSFYALLVPDWSSPWLKLTILSLLLSLSSVFSSEITSVNTRCTFSLLNPCKLYLSSFSPIKSILEKGTPPRERKMNVLSMSC